MDESERIQRIKDNRYLESHEIDSIDETFAARILALLNHPKMDKHCMVDAYYYDFSVIPHYIQESLNPWRDCYIIFGITTEGEIISKWVDRWDLDSEDPIVDGKVIHEEKKPTNFVLPEIKQFFDPKLLSTPTPQCMLNMFDPDYVPPPQDNTIDVKNMDICEDCKSKILSEFMKACKGSVYVEKEYNG